MISKQLTLDVHFTLDVDNLMMETSRSEMPAWTEAKSISSCFLCGSYSKVPCTPIGTIIETFIIIFVGHFQFSIQVFSGI